MAARNLSSVIPARRRFGNIQKEADQDVRSSPLRNLLAPSQSRSEAQFTVGEILALAHHVVSRLDGLSEIARSAATGRAGTGIGCGVRALKAGAGFEQNAYDAATWGVFSPLTERSVAGKSRPVEFPDFTGGRQKNTPPITLA